MPELTEDEKRAVTLQLQSKPSYLGDIAQYGAWMLPVVGLVVLGTLRKELHTVVLAFCVLVAMILWFIGYSHKHVVHLTTALKKYENEAKALDD